MRCALVEFNECHGEVLPTFVHLLDRLGYDVDVFLRARVLQGAPFAHCQDLRYRIHDLDRLQERVRVKLGHFGDYDLVVATSVEPKVALARVARARPPVIGVVHNGVLLEEDDDYRAFFSTSHRRPLTLAQHVGSATGAGWVAPVYLMDEPIPLPSEWRRFCVQGHVDFRRRNYWSLLDAVGELVAAGRTEFQVALVGGDYDLDGLRLRRTIRHHGLERTFAADDGWRSYASTLSRIADSGFVLPLVDTSSPLFAPYLSDKISSSLSMAIGLSRIPVVHRRLAELYGIEEYAITHEDGGLASAMGAALDLPAERRREMMDGLGQVRSRLLEGSLAELRRTLQALGVSVAH